MRERQDGRDSDREAGKDAGRGRRERGRDVMTQEQGGREIVQG